LIFHAAYGNKLKAGGGWLSAKSKTLSKNK